jgi:hypothetical protein
MVRITLLGVTFSLWQWIIIGVSLSLILIKVKSGLWKLCGLGLIAVFILFIKLPLFQHVGHEHELYDTSSSLQVVIPADWIQWNTARLLSSEARKQDIIAYAGDPGRKATVVVRQFKIFMFPGDIYPISYWLWSGTDLDTLEKRFDLLLTTCKEGLLRNLDVVDIQNAKHRGPTPRAFVLELEGNFRERGEGIVW